MQMSLAQQLPSEAIVADEDLFSLEMLEADPRLFLWRVDFRQRRMIFLKISEKTLADSSFLDHRIAHSRRQTLSVGFDEPV